VIRSQTSAFLLGLAIANFVLGAVAFVMKNPLIGGMNVVVGGSLLAIIASQKKNDDG
jgi:hypothetical protein